MSESFQIKKTTTKIKLIFFSCSVLVSLQSHPKVLVVDAKMFSQVSEHLRAVLFELELTRKILSE